MKSKAPLALMEQMVMVLIFALAAVLCLQAFALSDRMSRESELRDGAVVLAQNAAEVCKHSGGDLGKILQLMGGQVDETGWTAFYDQDLTPVQMRETAVYRVVMRFESADLSGLGRAGVAVYPTEGAAPLFELPVAWQKEMAGNG